MADPSSWPSWPAEEQPGRKSRIPVEEAWHRSPTVGGICAQGETVMIATWLCCPTSPWQDLGAPPFRWWRPLLGTPLVRGLPEARSVISAAYAYRAILHRLLAGPAALHQREAPIANLGLWKERRLIPFSYAEQSPTSGAARPLARVPAGLGMPGQRERSQAQRQPRPRTRRRLEYPARLPLRPI